jgi:CRP/FNR family transcriptional regulator
MKTHTCKDCPLKSPAARNLNVEELDVLEKNSALVHFKKGEVIFKEDALSLNVAYLRTGIVKVHKKGPTGEKILRIMKAPTYLGIPTSMGDKINQFSATALVETSVCFIDTILFRNFIFQNGKFAYEIIVELCRNELNDYERFTSQSQKQVHGIVAETLLCMSEKIFESPHFNFPLTRSELGDLAGTSRESVSRVLTELSSEKIIQFNTKEISILDKERLRQISEKG